MPELEPITREEKLLDGEDLTPITRKEKFIKRIYDKTQEIPEPVTREEMFLKKAGEGSGGDVTVEQLNVTENGTYSEEGKAFSPVVVEVPQPTMTKLTATENGTYTAPSGTVYNEVDVDVPLPENAYLLEEYEDVPTDIASFTASDAPLKSLTASIVPVQDLHGYDSPWAGGAGKNKINLADIVVPSAGFVYNRELVNLAVNTYTLSFNFIGSSGSISISLRNGETIVSTLQDKPLVNGLNVFTMPTLSNNADSISLYTGVGGTYENFMLEIGTQATSYEPYSNICPISGWDAAKVSDVGKNLIDDNLSDLEQGSIDGFSGSNSYSTSRVRTSAVDFDYDNIVNAGYQLTIPNGYKIAFRPYKEDGTYVYTDSTIIGFISFLPSIWVGKGIKKMRFVFAKTDESNITPSDIANVGYQLEKGSTATTYEPYAGTTTTIPFTDSQGNPVEVFGGSVDVVNGGEQPNTMAVIDLGQRSYIKAVDGFFYAYASDIDFESFNSTDKTALCECYKLCASSEWYDRTTDMAIFGNGASQAIYIADSRFTDADDLKTALNGIKLCYTLKNSTTFYTQPTSIKSLDGENNVSASTGQIEDLEFFTKEV